MKTRRFRIGNTAAILIVLVLAGLAIFPFYWMLVTATTPDSGLYGEAPQLWPDLTRLGVFVEVFQASTITRWLVNSLVIALGTTVVTLVLAVPIAYAFSRFSFRGKVLVGIGLFVTQMLPEAMLVVPLYSLFSPLGLLNSQLGLILANSAFTLPVITWILKNAIDTVPVDIEEAARVDGSTRFGVMTRMILPIIAPSLAAAAVISFFHGWNEYIFALTFINEDGLRTASVGLAGFVGELSTPIQSVMAVGVVYTLPAVVLYLLLQRFIVSGMSAGSVKG